MAIDPSTFHPFNVTDTCAVWNILSSARLRSAAREASCDFCITSYVHYECLVKPRTSPTKADRELRQKLEVEQRGGAFKAHSCSIGDLQNVRVLAERKRLGMGEISSIAFAMKIGHAVLTDDQKARKLATDTGHRLVQTTPHLFSWLIFTRRLGDSDVPLVVDQHQTLDGNLAPHLHRAYELALQCMLNARAAAVAPAVGPAEPLPSLD